MNILAGQAVSLPSGGAVMYKSISEHQISLFDFNQANGLELDKSNEWVRLADRIDWAAMEKKYAEMFPSKTGRPAIPLRMALGSLIIQKRKQVSDRALMKEIAENPYLQYFIGLETFEPKEPFRATSLVAFRKRFTADFLKEANELFLEKAGATPEHDGEVTEPEKKCDESGSGKEEGITNFGTLIQDATCSPSNIKYPQDFALLNDAREKLEEMIDYFHGEYHPWKKPRTYRQVARKEYLALAKSKRRTSKEIRKTVRKQLGYVRRDLGYIDQYLEKGYPLPKKYEQYLETIRALYDQQKYMFDNHTHRVDDRIVSISQPYIRPIVRGKSRTRVEFGAKYDVSIDEKGHARLEKLSFDAYNEGGFLQESIERYKERTGHYPARVLADQIYRTRANRAYCKEHNIVMSGPRLGRPAKDTKLTKQESQDNTDRIEVERFFSFEKRCCGAGLIMTRLEETTKHSIALSVLVANMFHIPLGPVFLLSFIDCDDGACGQYFVLFDEAAELYDVKLS